MRIEQDVVLLGGLGLRALPVVEQLTINSTKSARIPRFVQVENRMTLLHQTKIVVHFHHVTLFMV